ncbi:MAG: iron ABC transporter permease [Clostridia bacterium]|nr:iron ABC transporter permease [Clostridia bacterium]
MEKNSPKKSYCRTTLVFLVSLILLLAGIVLAVCVGKYPVSPFESIYILWRRLWGLGCNLPDMTQNVVMGLRVPRILASVIVGSALSMSGAAYQGIFKNPLVSPDFLGVSSGACIGAALAILFSLSTVFISIFAFIGGIAAVILTVSIPALIKNRSNLVLVLSGIIVGSALSSVFGFIKYIADPDTQLASITYWTMGSFSYIKLSELLVVLGIILVPAIVLVLLSWWIDVLSLGESEARALGANVKLVRGLAIICATVLTAGSVCIAGTISWVGLIIPHFGRILVGPSNRRLIPLCALIGGLFMLLVDTLTRTIGAEEMPVSILTGVIGAPFYCYLLFRQRRVLS